MQVLNKKSFHKKQIINKYFVLLLIILLGYIPSVKSQNCQPVKNLVLIYYGGIQRDTFKWDTQKLMHYIAYTNKSGETNYLFDSFLFLEFKDGRGYQYAPGYDHLNARKSEWKWLINRYLGKRGILDSLNLAIKKVRAKTQTKFFKRNIIIGIPTPINNQKDWGTLQNKKLDFTNNSDREKAIEWYIDAIQKLFKQKKYRNFVLNGFYWIDEDNRSSLSILPKTAQYIHHKKLKFYWIPYWSAAGAKNWKELGFDMAWQQPNYYFQPKVDQERLEAACSFAKKNQMGVEVEFDNRIMSKNNEDYRNRLINYLRVIRKNKLSPKYMSVAFYQGNDGFYQLITSKDMKDQELVKLLIHFLIGSHYH